jgi:hypothetical protein
MEDSKQVAHLHAHFRVWKRRFYELNIWTAKKRDEKLHYMHNNPVKRGLVKEPGDWPWSRRGGAILFSGRRFASSYGHDTVRTRQTAGRIHPDKNRRNVCATRRGCARSK